MGEDWGMGDLFFCIAYVFEGIMNPLTGHDKWLSTRFILSIFFLNMLYVP